MHETIVMAVCSPLPWSRPIDARSSVLQLMSRGWTGRRLQTDHLSIPSWPNSGDHRLNSSVTVDFCNCRPDCFLPRWRTSGSLLIRRTGPSLFSAAAGTMRRHLSRKFSKLSLRQKMATSSSPRCVNWPQKRVTSDLHEVKTCSARPSRASARPIHHDAAITITARATTRGCASQTRLVRSS